MKQAPVHCGIYARFVKRVLDVFLSFFALLLLSPVILVLFILVRIKLGSPAFFAQERPGKDGKIFRMYKFRTMIEAFDENGQLLPDEKRMTRFGSRLRALSLDELPEFFNILKGDMSFVGPRPLLVSYLPLYNERQSRRHLVRPGLTGLAQINGRNATTWKDRLEYDVQYAENISFAKDVKIVFATVGKVLRREGISGEGSVTMTAFTGNEEEN